MMHKVSTLRASVIVTTTGIIESLNCLVIGIFGITYAHTRIIRKVTQDCPDYTPCDSSTNADWLR